MQNVKLHHVTSEGQEGSIYMRTQAKPKANSSKSEAIIEQLIHWKAKR